jgi:hypothetical protein
MQQPAPTQPSPTASSFAGLLATFASPPPAPQEDEALWSASDLGEDVATLSYERALRTHARYRPLDRGLDRGVDRGVEHSADRGVGDRLPSPAPSPETQPDAAMEAGAASAAVEERVAFPLSTGLAPDRDLRQASVTIRMSKAECARLRARAAEAGLTVSAYLRSCALEAEVLRAQVKQALAELKTGSEGTKQQGSKPAGHRGNDGVRLTRVFGHIGKLWLGLSAGKSA